MTTGAFLTAEWHYLAMLNYEVDPTILLPHVPQGTELDRWNGKTFASMVGFRFLNTKVLNLPVPLHEHFDEVNLRFYVRRKREDGWVRGTVFIKEIVPHWAIATVARFVYNENYVSLPMRHSIELEGGMLKRDSTVEYGWRFGGRWNRMAVQTIGDAQPIAAGSEAEFITEHYWGYARQRDGGTVEYQVEHPRWLVWQVSATTFECDVASLYGPQFVPYLCVPPSSAFLAQGSPVIVRQGERIV